MLHSRLQPWLECNIRNASVPLINWEAASADLKSCTERSVAEGWGVQGGGGRVRVMLGGRGGALNATLNAGHATTKAQSHSYDSYLIAVLQRAIRLCLPLPLADICLSRTLRLVSSFLLAAKPHTVGGGFVQPLPPLHGAARRRLGLLFFLLNGLFQNMCDLGKRLSLAINQEDQERNFRRAWIGPNKQINKMQNSV